MKKHLSIVAGALLTTAFAGSAPAPPDDHPTQNWWLLEETRILPAPVPTRDWHRLANLTNSMQVVARSAGYAPASFTRIEDGKADNPSAVGRNMRIRRLVDDPSFESSKPTGDVVLLNEQVGLYFQGSGFLVYRKGASGLGLGWQAESRFNPLRQDRDVYQWRFEVPRDHRSRPIKTKEHLALRNTLRNAHLVLNGSSRRIAWYRP